MRGIDRRALCCSDDVAIGHSVGSNTPVSHFDFTNPVRISVINQNSPGRRLGVAIEPG
jgi:hypothetical protein